MSKDPTIGMFVGDAEIERRKRKRVTTPLPDQPPTETLEEIAESIVRLGIPYSAFRYAQDYKDVKTWLTGKILSALRNERERCAKVAESHFVNHKAVDSSGLIHEGQCHQAIAAAIREGK